MLLNVPRYDFNWQTRYEMAEPKTLPAGTRIHCVAHYDNSENNLNNPDPSATVRWGDQTWQEMMIGYFDILVSRKQFDSIRPKGGNRGGGRVDADAAAKRVIKLLDKNGDGKLAKKEAPARLQRYFGRLDKNKDGFLTPDEIKSIAALLERFRR